MIKYHISDYWCRGPAGIQDYGALSTFWEAAQEVARLLDSGYRGGCRCKPGWTIFPCGWESRDHKDCYPYDIKRFDCEENYD